MFTLLAFLVIGYTFLVTPPPYISDFKVNDNTLSSYRNSSRMGVDSAGNFVIFWNDMRDNPGMGYPAQTYCQIYTNSGVARGTNFKVGGDTTSGYPGICVLENGRFIVTWCQDSLNAKLYLLFQRFDNAGVPLSNPIKVVDTNFLSNYLNGGPVISSSATGTFVICWSKANTWNTPVKVYFQRYDSSGNSIGLPDSAGDVFFRDGVYPAIASNRDGSFVIAWGDTRADTGGASGYDIYMQRYTSGGVKIGSNVKVSDAVTPSQYRGGVHVATDGKGRIVLDWGDDWQCGAGDVFYQLFDSSGGRIGSNKKANNSPCAVGINANGNVSMRPDGKFFIYWSDWNYSGKEQSYGRRFDSLGNAVGNEYMIPTTSPGSSTQRADDMKLLGDRVFCTWTDNRNGPNNSDIYCNVKGFQNPDTIIGINDISSTAGRYRLYPAHPNPFNPSTKINYTIPNDSKVRLEIYDILGRLVRTLVDGSQKAGYYSVAFDGTNLASGVYFYRIEAGTFVSSKKMVLLK